MFKEDEIEKLNEVIFELRQETTRLLGQITYLQEELSSIEDDRDKQVERLKDKINDLEYELSQR